MRRRVRYATCIFAATTMVLLGGCSADTPSEPNPGPVASSSHASPQESAEANYRQYLAAVTEMYVTGDDDYTELLEFATAEMASREAAAVAELAANGVTVEAWYTVERFGTVSLSEQVLELPVCVDVAAVRLFGPTGSDFTPTGRPDHVPLNLRFDVMPGEMPLLDAQDPWDPAKASPCVQ
ncbi:MULTISPECIES: hypothetical protein [unclassified Agrococcus]|uniref:hypothetical protein n=1 Tax=unclassified Agrococcus TaxID=2615065 RepID=UPI0036074590